ncbi:MAG: hypothetical protein SGPRY_001497 [Prymnesium sp.]
MADRLFNIWVGSVDIFCRSEKNLKVTVHVSKAKAEQLKLAILKSETREEAVDCTIREANSSWEGDQKHHQTGQGSSGEAGEPAQLVGIESMCCVVNEMLMNANVSAGPTAAAEGTSKLQRKCSRPDRFNPYVELTVAEQQRLLGRARAPIWRYGILRNKLIPNHVHGENPRIATACPGLKNHEH